MSDNGRQGRAAGLRRGVGLPLFVFFGVGNIVGAGIYVLIGKVAGEAGYSAPFAFLVAAFIAGFTGLSYGELAARYPLSAGEAVYLDKAFHSRFLAGGIGLLIAFAGLVSAATIARGFVGYVNVFAEVPGWLVIVVAVVATTAIAIRGIVESTWLNAVLTLIETGGLIWVVIAAAPAVLSAESPRVAELLPMSGVAWSGVLAGAFIAFYAFIGFEDMVNIAEEVREPARTLPKGIVIAFLISTSIYVLLAVVAIYAVAPAALAQSDAPLAAVCEASGGCSARFISLIGLAVINGALLQIVMASRIFYGLSCRGWLPQFLSRVSPRRRTPVAATLLAGGLTLALAWLLPLLSLAKLTSGLVLVVFILINAALIRIKARDPVPPEVRPVSLAVPVAGLLGSLFILATAAI